MRALPLLLVIGAASEARADLRLDEVLRQVVEQSPDQAIARAQIAIAEADVRTASMWPNPGFVLRGQRTSPAFSAAIQLRLPIFGQRGAQLRAAARTVDQTRAEASAIIWHLRHEARVAYYAAVRAEEEVVIALEIEALTNRVAAMAEERFDVGTGTRLEKEQAALLHVRAQQDVSDRRAVTSTSRQELARLLGVSSDTLGALTDGLAEFGSTPPHDELDHEVRTRHPELKALTIEREAARLRADAGRADRRPIPSVELGLDLLDPGGCGGTERCVSPRGALSFNLPIFNLNRGPISRAEAEARLAEKKAMAVAVRIDAALRTAYTRLDAAMVRARFFDTEYEPAAVRVEQMAREGFRSGRTGILPLIEAERAVLEARLGHVNALFAVQVARADLEEAGGVPLPTP